MKKLVLVSALFAACMMSSVWAGQIVGIQKFVVQKGTNVLSAVMFGSPDGQFLAQPLKRQLFEYRAGDTFVWTLDGKECVYRFDGAHWYDAEGKDADEVVLPSLKDGIVFVREVDERSSISISGQLSSDEQAKFDALTQRQGSQVAKRLPMKPTLSMKPSSLHRNGLLEFGRFLVFWGCIIALPMMLFARPKKGRRRTLLRYGVLTVFVSALGFMWLAPSCDRLEEAHGFVLSGKYLVGNGVLVGMQVDGKDRVAFLTSRNAVTCKMLETGRSFADAPADENRLCINKVGSGFRYVEFDNINPRRWQISPIADQDFAWIVLNEEELAALGGVPSYLHLPNGPLDSSPDVAREHDCLAMKIDVGSDLAVTRLVGPVFGKGRAASMWYFDSVFRISVPFASSVCAVAVQDLGKLAAHSQRITMLNDDARGVKESELTVLQMALSTHANNSGSPVFVKDLEGHPRFFGILVGLGEECAFFQTLDRILPFVCKSLQNKQ